MPMIRITWIALYTTACAGVFDTDGDGLPDTREEELGTDVTKSDSDGDGLEDLAEVEVWGTDPLSNDSDGDGADDNKELELCLDPLDDESHPYTLGWPMVPCEEKNDLMTGVTAPSPQEGTRIRRAFLHDAAGEIFDLYDLSARPSIVVIYQSNRLENSERPRIDRWLSGDPAGPSVEYFPPYWVRDAAIAGDIYVAFVIKDFFSEAGFMELPTIEFVAEYCTFDTFGCFGDLSQELNVFEGPIAEGDDLSDWILVDEQMIVRSVVTDAAALGPEAFDDLEEKLAIMLNITPP